MEMERAVAAIATAPGAAGIAVIRVSGQDAYVIVDKIFHPKNTNRQLKSAKGYTALYGSFHQDGQILDDGVVLCFRAPHSYTGEDVLELSCHGGEAVSRALLEACYKSGAAPAAPGEFTRRALLNGKMSLIQAEAVMDLISATSKRSAALAGAAVMGVLQNELVDIKTKLVQLAGHLAAFTDYPEEDVEELERSALGDGMQTQKTRLKTLIQNYDKGVLLRRGVTAAIVGSPNVGKSTLFNLLSGFERAIVTPVAGTTRDVLREQIQVDGVVLQLSDTAGLHRTDDIVEAEGIRRSRQEIETAGLVIAVFDGSKPLDRAGDELARQCKGRPALALVNKSDLGTVVTAERLLPFFSEVLVVSAKDTDTVKLIESAVLRILDVHDIDSDTPMLANDRQLAAAVDAKTALEDGLAALDDGLGLDATGICLEDSLRALSILLGEDATQAVIDEVFSKFCVGK